MADQTNKEFAPLEACRELSKSLNDLIVKYQRDLADLHERELKKNSAQMIPGGDARPNMVTKNAAMGYGNEVPGAGGGAQQNAGPMALSELPAAKEVKSAKSVIKTMCKSCGKSHETGKCMRKGEVYIDKRNETDGNDSGVPGKRMKDIGNATPNIPKPKRVSPRKHEDGGNDGDCIREGAPQGKAGGKMLPSVKGKDANPNAGTGDSRKIYEKNPGKAGGKDSGPAFDGGGARMDNDSFTVSKADVPMAKPPSGGTGLAPKAPAMAKPGAAGATPKPAGGAGAMPKPPMMAKAGARMNNPKVEQGKPSINTMAKAFGEGARPGPGTMAGDAMSASHKAAAPSPAAAPKKAIAIPGRAADLASFTPAGKFTGAGASLPGAKQPIALPGKGKPAVSGVNPAASHFSAPPAGVKPAAAPAPKPGGPAAPAMGAKPAPRGTAYPSMPSTPPRINRFGKNESFGNCAICSKAEHSGDCSQS